ncbi:MAG: carboxypeptidase-like regulatory domain-containing protein [Solirubrobacteraceae bacterium]|nr:carboxypeptidase-like regulatory domain-containing protein [Solirubrobacteraceae bacterium]
MIGRRLPLAVVALVLGLLALPAMAAADGTISGSLRGATGAPLENALLGTTEYGRSYGLIPIELDASGRFTTKLPEGKYLLVAYDLDSVHASKTWPNAASVSGGSPITVTDGAAVTGLDLQLELAGTLAGTIRDAGGKVVPGAWVALTFEGEVFDERAAGKDGRYEYSGLAAGTWTVDVTGPTGSKLPPAHGEVTIVSGKATPADFVLGTPTVKTPVDPPGTAPKTPPSDGPITPPTTEVGGLTQAAPTIVAPVRGRVAVTKGTIIRAVQCPAGSRCAATVSVVTAKKVRDRKTGRKGFVVVAKGRLDTTVARSSVALRLTAAGKKLLRRGGRRGLKVTLRTAPALPNARAQRFPMTLVARG